MFAVAHHVGGPGAVAFLSGVLIALCFVVLFWQLLWRGADFFVAVAVCLVAAGASTIHFLARPHVFSLLLLAVSEFQSPRFRSESALDFELLLAAAILAAAALAKRRRYGEALLIAGWGHAALVSVRHVPVFAIAAAPAIAEAASRWWRESAAGLPARSPLRALSRMAGEFAGPARRTSVWPALLVVTLALAPLSRPRDFPEAKFPVALVARHPELAGGRVFTSDQWADYLIYRTGGRARVFMDGRSDFYGEARGRLYLGLIQGMADWRENLDSAGFTHVLTHREWPLASLLREHPGWKLVDREGTALLFVPDPALRLKKTPESAEIANGGRASETNKRASAKAPGNG